MGRQASDRPRVRPPLQAQGLPLRLPVGLRALRGLQADSSRAAFPKHLMDALCPSFNRGDPAPAADRGEVASVLKASPICEPRQILSIAPRGGGGGGAYT
mmetsp:Transcript_83181/g.168767  ORF Transcript_83181/g.168767 Transcript_83181/m.168767 type:complete len:100 (-) Transcript_83181:51-350(-)